MCKVAPYKNIILDLVNNTVKQGYLRLSVNIENTGPKIRIFFYFVIKTLLVNYFHKYCLKVFVKPRKVENTARSSRKIE